MKRNVLAVLSLVLLVACNAPGPRSVDVAALPYGKARAYDFMDMFDFSLGAGAGLHLAGAIEPFRVGYGYYDASKFGMMGRAAGKWEEKRQEFFLIHDINCWEKTPCCGDGYLFDQETIHPRNFIREPEPYTREPFYANWGWVTRWHDWERQWLDVVVQGHLLFVSFDVAFSPQEMMDFLLGFGGVDTISHDDFEPVPVEVMQVSQN